MVRAAVPSPFFIFFCLRQRTLTATNARDRFGNITTMEWWNYLYLNEGACSVCVCVCAGWLAGWQMVYAGADSGVWCGQGSRLW